MADVPVSITHSLKKTWHYQLTRGGVVLANLRPVDDWQYAEYPCIEAKFSATDEYEPVRRLFERELLLLDAEEDDQINEWSELWEDLKSEPMFVQNLDQSERFDILWIHIHGDRAWWWPLYNSPETVLPDSSG
ncbi:MAG TPA: hypothetical protein DDW52_10425 [Planctomycetaceae bacterium]|nr:hypothetical protein [Planctomycetaceae bacterium]